MNRKESDTIIDLIDIAELVQFSEHVCDECEEEHKREQSEA